MATYAAAATPIQQHGNDGLALAAINGTILAIILAASLGYLLIVFQSLDTLVTRYIERANRSNDLQFRSRFHAAAFAAENLSEDDLRTVLMMLASNHPAPELGIPDPSDAAGRGKVLGTVLPRLASRPPFLDWGGTLVLNDESAVREWRQRFEVAVRFLVGDRNLSEGRFRDLAEAADAAMLKESGGLWATRPHTKIVEEFDRFLDRAVEIDRDAATDERAIDLYRQRLPTRRVVGAAIAVLVSVFIGGVAVPMVHPSVSTVFDAWFPATVYVVCLSFGAVQVWRHTRGLQ